LSKKVRGATAAASDVGVMARSRCKRRWRHGANSRLKGL